MNFSFALNINIVNFSCIYILDPIANGYSTNVDLIPRATKVRCPRDTYYKDELGTCSCEEHCNWDSCRLTNPPKECLREMDSEWRWDYTKQYWVAQVIQGIKSQRSKII